MLSVSNRNLSYYNGKGHLLILITTLQQVQVKESNREILSGEVNPGKTHT